MAGQSSQPALVDLPRAVKISPAPASETASGSIEIATQAETNTGTADDRAVTPLKMATRALLQGKHTIWIPAGAMRPTVSNGCASLVSFETTAGRPDINYLAFDAGADEHAQFEVFFPNGWDGGTITFIPVWTVNAAVSTGVAIALQAVGTADNETQDVVYGTAIVVTDDAQGAVEERLIGAESGAVTIDGTLTFPSVQTFDVFRDTGDGNDDMTQDMWLEGIAVFYTIDTGNDV